MGILAGLALALLSIYFVLEPLLRTAAGRTVAAPAPLFSDSDDEDDPVLARKARALAALKEIDFDRATGKLSDEDYERLKAEYTIEALEALRDTQAAPADAPTLPRSHSPTIRFCLECGAPLSGNNRFCVDCGTPLGAVAP